MNAHIDPQFLKAVHSREPVAGLTHTFYRYPARFSPQFARAAIEAFTKPGDIVLDPFMGGGTTLVEARVLGRRAIGIDISNLAVFVSTVKTTILSESNLSLISAWADGLEAVLNLRNATKHTNEWRRNGYQQNITGRATWHIRKILELALDYVHELPGEKQQHFARCALLKTAQWALDSRIRIPTAKEFRRQICLYLDEMIDGARSYANAARSADRLYHVDNSFRTLCLYGSTIGIDTDERLSNKAAPALILTSPPYPGVHVLYHRWQVQGRKETPAPFWIANSLDGNGASFYTFGDRKKPDLVSYYQQAEAAFSSLARLINKKTIMVQMIAFSDPDWQLPEYLHVMKRAGFREIKYSTLSNSPDGRIWREIPNRKWYASQHDTTATSKEVIFFHKLT